MKLAPTENLNLNKKKLKIHKDTHKSEIEKVSNYPSLYTWIVRSFYFTCCFPL